MYLRPMDLKVLISAPTDQAEEVRIALDAVEQLNTILEIHGHSITAKHWLKNVSTGRGKRAQDVINDQIIDCDAIVAIIGPRLGTRTDEFESGTVEEIYTFLEKKHLSEVLYDVHVFFNAKDLGNPLEINTEELARVQKFRSNLNGKGINFAQFSSDAILKNLIQVGLNTLVGKSKPFVPPENIDPLEDFDELGSDEAVEIAAESLSIANSMVSKIAEALDLTTKNLTSLKDAISLNEGDPRQFLSDLANILDTSRRELEPLVKSMRENFDKSYAYMNLAVSIVKEDSIATGESPDFGELPASLDETLRSAREARTAFSGTRKSLDRIPRRTTALRKSKKGLTEVYDSILHTLEALEQDLHSLIVAMNV